MTAVEPLFAAEAVSKHYRGGAGGGTPPEGARGAGGGITALTDVTLDVPHGAFFAVTGPSGGGKSTLLSLLGALDRPTSGEVRFAGERLGELSDAARARIRRRIGFVFQHSPMIRGLGAWENVTYPLIPLGVSARERRTRAARVLEAVGLGSHLTQRPEQMSGGELQRLGIARALVADPTALVADEPTSNLDRDSTATILTLLRGLHARGVTILVATHDDALLAHATQVVKVEAGRVLPPRA